MKNRTEQRLKMKDRKNRTEDGETEQNRDLE